MVIAKDSLKRKSPFSFRVSTTNDDEGPTFGFSYDNHSYDDQIVVVSSRDSLVECLTLCTLL
jgi:hypothetical protein